MHAIDFRLRSHASLSLVTALACFSACAAEQAAPAESVEQAAAKLETAADWSQYNNHNINLLPASDGFCFLTRMTGHFLGGGELVSVDRDDASGYWVLGGVSGQDGVAASAHCVTWDEVGGNERHNGSTQMAVNASSGSGSWPFPDEHYAGDVDLWDQRSLCPLTGVGGAFNGHGERVFIEPSGNNWHLSVDNWTMWGYANRTSGYSYCAYLGQTGNVQYWGGDPRNAGEFTWVQNNPQIFMAPVDQAVCYLTGVTGKFTGADEWVAVWEQDGNWILSGQSNESDVQARARCVSRRQNGLVSDGGFERQKTRSSPSGMWSSEGSGAGVDLGLGFQRSGANNGFIYHQTGAWDWSAITQQVPVDMYTNYVLKGWFRTGDKTTETYFSVRSGSTGAIINETKIGAIVGAYQEREVHFNSGPNTTLKVYVGNWAPPNQASWLQVDDVTMTWE
jgi:hypothetical protein